MKKHYIHRNIVWENAGEKEYSNEFYLEIEGDTARLIVSHDITKEDILYKEEINTKEKTFFSTCYVTERNKEIPIPVNDGEEIGFQLQHPDRKWPVWYDDTQEWADFLEVELYKHFNFVTLPTWEEVKEIYVFNAGYNKSLRLVYKNGESLDYNNVFGTWKGVGE